MNTFRLLAFAFALIPSFAFADVKSVRWTAAEDTNTELSHVLDVLNAKTGLKLTASDFISIEDLDLATSHFTYLAQTAAGVPVKGASLRIWKSKQTGETVQIEADVDDGVKRIVDRFKAHSGLIPSALTESKAVRESALKLVRSAIKTHGEDTQIRSLQASDFWQKGELVRIFTVKASHGTHKITVALASRKIVSQDYEQYPQADGEYAAPVSIFQMYEETEDQSTRLERIPSVLKYLKAKAVRVDTNPYVTMMDHEYKDTMFDPVLGMTEEGRAKGYWAMAYVKKQAALLREAFPKTDNTFAADGSASTAKGVILDGRYATVNLHPAAGEKFGPLLNFTPGVSAQFKPDWVENPDGSYQMIPKGSVLGRPMASLSDLLSRPARRLADHDPATYINDGFDELQVYWAITTLFDELQQRGFNDPELSTRPFNAFLYDPDLSMRDNAYYTDDTINFTTYSSGSQNMARDNPTIWHELGHGVMDRLMGDMITLADTGGLSEGMADYVAELVVESVTKHQPFPGHERFRIINQTRFNLTNEVHDDGEAYGGSMRDFMVAAIDKMGQEGLHKAADLTMETMRLTRDNPGLTAGGWFSHMLFADELGRPGVRAPGELKELLLKALGGRNFDLNDEGLAKYSLKADGKELDKGEPGTRDHEIRHSLKPTETAKHHITVALTDGARYQFKYPVTVAVEFKTHALQGAVHWMGEEQNPRVFTIEKAGDVLEFDLEAAGTCDAINRPDGTCSDYAYVQIINQGETVPVAKKRFYVRIKTDTAVK